MAVNDFVGVDVGAHSIKVARMRRIGGKLALVGLGAAPLEDLSQTHEGKGRNAKVGLLLRDVLRDAGIRGRRGVTSVPGKRLFYRYISVPAVPAWRLKALMQYEIEEENEGAAGNVSYDYCLLHLPSKMGELTVLVAMAKNEVTQPPIQVLREAGLRVQDIQPSASALFNAFQYSLAPDAIVEDTGIILSIGAENVDMVIQSNGRFSFARNLTNAGNSFTEALQEEFNLPFAEAEKLKIERGKILPPDAEYDEANRTYEVRISEALASAADQLANSVQASLMYCRAQLKVTDLKPQKLILCGGGAALPGLVEYLASRLRLQPGTLPLASQFDLSRLGRPELHQLEREPGRYATAIGLALTGFEREERLSLSLLTEKEKSRRVFHLTSKYLYYAAACLIAALLLSVYTSYTMRTDLGSKGNQLRQLNEDAKKKTETVKARRVTVEKLLSKVEALTLRAYSSQEAFDFLTLLTDRGVVPDEINLSSIRVGRIRPLAFRDTPEETKDGELRTPSERLAEIAGYVRTVPPPAIDMNATGKERPVPPPENYKNGLSYIDRLDESLEKHPEVVYKSYRHVMKDDPVLEEQGAPLEFTMKVELVPKTVTGRFLLEQASQPSPADSSEKKP